MFNLDLQIYSLVQSRCNVYIFSGRDNKQLYLKARFKNLAYLANSEKAMSWECQEMRLEK